MEWPALDIRPVPDAVVIYAQSDGIVCAWDPARNYREGAADAGARSLPSFSFRPQAVFDGLTLGGHQVCNGLIDDWVDWEARRPYLFRKLAAAIEE